MSFLSQILSTWSGNSGLKVSEQLLFDKVIGFRGLVPGVGTSTIVQNVAIALVESYNFSVCVLDTSFMYPILYSMLVKQPDARKTDLLDFTGELSEIVTLTSYRGVSLVSLSNKTIIDMLSSKDNQAIVDKLLDVLKSYFDVILVDLSHEPTNLSAYSAIKCNRIVSIADYSLKCVYNLQKSLNTLATLGVPLGKANNAIINKVVPGILINIQDTLKNAGLTVLGEIPLSHEIVRRGLAGKRVYSHSTSDRDLYNFSSVIDTILKEVIHITPLTTRYLADETKATENSTVDEYDDYTFVDSLTVRTVIDEDPPEAVKDAINETTSSNESTSEVIKETNKNAVSSNTIADAPKEVSTESESFSADVILEVLEED